MTHLPSRIKRLLAIFTALIALILSPVSASAHCDTMNGPVVLDAAHAIETGNVTPVLKWVPAQDEAEVREAFARTLEVRKTNAAARELADRYFYETVVRIHRMSEGVGYTGLKPATAVAPAIAAADRALETGDVAGLADLLGSALQTALTERFVDAREARQHADHSVHAGREFVAAYVRFTHFAEAIEAVTSHAPGDHGTQESTHAHDAQ